MQYNLGDQDQKNNLKDQNKYQDALQEALEATIQAYDDIFLNLKELIIMQRVNQIPNEMPYP